MPLPKTKGASRVNGLVPDDATDDAAFDAFVAEATYLGSLVQKPPPEERDEDYDTDLEDESKWKSVCLS